MPSSRLSSFFLTDRLITSHPQKKNTSSTHQHHSSYPNSDQQLHPPANEGCRRSSDGNGAGTNALQRRLGNSQHPIPADTMAHEPCPSSPTTTSPHGMSPSSTSASLPKSRASSVLSGVLPYRRTVANPGATTTGPSLSSTSSPRASTDLLSAPSSSSPSPPAPAPALATATAPAAPKHRPKQLQIATRPRDDPQRAISAPLVTAFAMDSLLKSPQLNQRCTLPSGRVVSYAVCGAKQGKPVVYFYGLGGSRRQLALLHAQALRLGLRVYCMDRPGTGYTQILSKKKRAALRERAQARMKSEQQQDDDEDEEEQAHRREEPTMEEDDHHHATTANKKHRRSRSGNISSHSSRIAGLASSLFFSSSSASSSSGNSSQQQEAQHSSPTAPYNSVLERIDEVCHEVIDWLDIVIDNHGSTKGGIKKPPTKVSLMSHSCGVYYVMRMLALYPDRIKEGPVCLLTPWVPFNECPTTTSNTFKAVRYVPRGLVWAFTSSFNHLGSALLPASNALSDSIAATANMIGESSSAPAFLDRRPGSPISPKSPMSPFPPSPCSSTILGGIGRGGSSPSRAMSLSSTSLASLTSLTMPGAAFPSPHPSTILQHQDDGYATPPFPTTPSFAPISSAAAAAAAGLWSGPSSWSLGDLLAEEGRHSPPLPVFGHPREASSPTIMATTSDRSGHSHHASNNTENINNNHTNNSNSQPHNTTTNNNNKSSHRLSFLSLHGGAASQMVRNSFETVTSTVSSITGFCTRRVGGGFERRRNSCPAGTTANHDDSSSHSDTNHDHDHSKSVSAAAAVGKKEPQKKKKSQLEKEKKPAKERGKRKTERLQVPTVEIERPKDPFLEPFKEAVEKVALPAMLEDLNHQHSRGYNLEIQLCISDAGFTLNSVELPKGVEIHAYCGHQDKMVPLEASQEMAQKCGWKMHEFMYSGHGGPRMLMTALEDLALADPS
ncbi:hypothetical protein BGZ73_004428 [Actinomortierella ambigua]|nr:hypothetical protein BGZ73_004428 [Actinomortierella ambigua]